MRTTLAIDDRVLEHAKREAAAQGITLGRYVQEAIQAQLVAQAPQPSRVHLPVFDGTGLQPGVHPGSNRDMYEALDTSKETAA